MSKRLNKRQQREQEELAQLQAATPTAVEQQSESSDNEEQVQSTQQPSAANLFAALNAGQEGEASQSDSEASTAPEPAKPASKKKKSKKKNKSTAAAAAAAADQDDTAASTPKKTKTKGSKSSDPFEGMDELDRALAEMKLKYKDEPEASTSAGHSSSTQSSTRNLLSVDPKHLDADAELRKFFGSKVVSSTSTSQNAVQARRQAQLNKLKTTLAKPKLTWPPPTALSGLTMREVDFENGERTFTFEHSPQWREAQMQFVGATRSHDPNQLFALLQVFPWHVDTLLQMSEVYRLQSDIGAASDYAERALFAFDRCLIPAFNITSGTCRLDFERVENRPMFTALHRNIAYLGRRGCWLTAFTFAKLLFALDPHNDPHAAGLWLDFLAVKTANGPWLLEMLEDKTFGRYLSYYPGMAYARALALREQDPAQGDQALQSAIHSFPEVIPVLADKIGASIPPAIRSHPLFAIRAGYEADDRTSLHLLAHLYVSRSDALWKEDDRAKWLSAQVEIAFASMPTNDDKRSGALKYFGAASYKVPENLCRHVMVTESTSYLGFLPPAIAQRPMVSYDPLPPSDGTSFYDNAYFAGFRAAAGVKNEDVVRIVRSWESRLNAALVEAFNRGDEDITRGLEPVVRGMLRDLASAGSVSEEQKALAINLLLGGIEETLGEAQDAVQAIPGAFPA